MPVELENPKKAIIRISGAGEDFSCHG